MVNSSSWDRLQTIQSIERPEKSIASDAMNNLCMEKGPLPWKDRHSSTSLKVRPCSGGRPSRIVLNLKSGQNLMESTDLDLRKCSCMYYVLMKVIKKPRAYNNLERCIIA